MCTLSASVSVAGDGLVVFSGPVEVVWRSASHVTPECDGAAWGHQHPVWDNSHHHRCCFSFRGQRPKHEMFSVTNIAVGKTKICKIRELVAVGQKRHISTF